MKKGLALLKAISPTPSISPVSLQILKQDLKRLNFFQVLTVYLKQSSRILTEIQRIAITQQNKINNVWDLMKIIKHRKEKEIWAYVGNNQN